MNARNALKARSAMLPSVLKKLIAHWFTPPVQMTIFGATELIVMWDMYLHRSHPAQAVAHVVLALILALLWWRASRANSRDAYDNLIWISCLTISGLSLIPDLIS